MQTGLNGMLTSQAEIQKSADQIVRAGTIDRDSSTISDFVEPIVTMKIEQRIFDASAKIVKTADEMLGTLMDIRA
jgi:flagellar hook-associated protein FlgK